MALVLAVWSDDALNLIAALSTMALYASYALPILMGLLRRRRGGWPRTGPFTLGTKSPFIGWVAVSWVVVAIVMMGLPPTGDAGIAFAVTVAALLVVGFGGVRRRFKGPPVGRAE